MHRLQLVYLLRCALTTLGDACFIGLLPEPNEQSIFREVQNITTQNTKNNPFYSIIIRSAWKGDQDMGQVRKSAKITRSRNKCFIEQY